MVLRRDIYILRLIVLRLIQEKHPYAWTLYKYFGQPYLQELGDIINNLNNVFELMGLLHTHLPVDESMPDQLKKFLSNQQLQTRGIDILENPLLGSEQFIDRMVKLLMEGAKPITERVGEFIESPARAELDANTRLVAFIVHVASQAYLWGFALRTDSEILEKDFLIHPVMLLLAWLEYAKGDFPLSDQTYKKIRNKITKAFKQLRWLREDKTIGAEAWFKDLRTVKAE